MHNIDTFATEPLAARFALEMRQIRKADCGANAEKMKKLKQVTPRPAEYLQYALNTAKERELIDKAIQVVKDAGGTVLALEHDGLCVHLPAEEFETFNRDMQCALGVNYPYTLQPTPSVEKALEKAKLVMCQGPLPQGRGMADTPPPDLPGLHGESCTSRPVRRGDASLPGSQHKHPLQHHPDLQDTGGHRTHGVVLMPAPAVDHHRRFMDSLKSCIQIIAQRDLGHYVDVVCLGHVHHEVGGRAEPVAAGEEQLSPGRQVVGAHDVTGSPPGVAVHAHSRGVRGQDHAAAAAGANRPV